MSGFKAEDYTILVVDDEHDLAEIIQEDLADYGFNVILAHSGHEAFDIFHNQKIDYVLSDIKMPDGDGCELLDNIKKENPKLPVVMLMTGFSEYSENDLVARGAEGLLTKPIDTEMIYEGIKDFFESKKAS